MMKRFLAILLAALMVLSMATFGTLGIFVRNIAVSSGELALYRAVLAAVMIEALMEIQNERQPVQTFRKPVNVLIPVNLRKYFDSTTLRNFVLFVLPGINPAWGNYTFEEIVSQVYHRMGAEITGKHFNTRFAGNVHAEEIAIVKVIPLFIKNIILMLTLDIIGNVKPTISLQPKNAIIE